MSDQPKPAKWTAERLSFHMQQGTALTIREQFEHLAAAINASFDQQLDAERERADKAAARAELAQIALADALAKYPLPGGRTK